MSASPYREESAPSIKTMSEIMATSQQKTMLDRIYNATFDNRMLGTIPIFKGPSGAIVKIKRKGPRNERDELLDFFYERLAPAYEKFTKKPLMKGYLAMKISHLKDRDLFFLKSDCLDAERRGQTFSKVFWGSLRVRENGNIT